VRKRRTERDHAFLVLEFGRREDRAHLPLAFAFEDMRYGVYKSSTAVIKKVFGQKRQKIDGLFYGLRRRIQF
jgi:hypothetical protein